MILLINLMYCAWIPPNKIVLIKLLWLKDTIWGQSLISLRMRLTVLAFEPAMVDRKLILMECYSSYVGRMLNRSHRGVRHHMACTYASVEIQRTPELRVFKKCLFYDKPCAEVRAARMCPLLRRPTQEQTPPTILEVPKTEREVLSDELSRIDSIPITSGELKPREAARTEARKKTEEAKPEGPSDSDMLRAELSDFMNKIDTKKEKPETAKRTTGARKRS